MTRRMQLLVYTLLPAATAIIAGIVSILTVALGWQTGLSVLARIHRRTPMDGVRKAEGGVRELQGK